MDHLLDPCAVFWFFIGVGSGALLMFVVTLAREP
jgi:hypothetical protein